MADRTDAAGAPRVVITGMGVASPLGNSPRELFHRLSQGETALRTWRDLEHDGYRCAIAARIVHVEGDPLRRGRVLAIGAVDQAIAGSGITLPRSTGVYIGSTLGESVAFERAAEGEPLDVGEYAVPSFTEGIRKRFGL